MGARQSQKIDCAHASRSQTGPPGVSYEARGGRLVRRQYLDGQRVDLALVARSLDLSRATLYRWFGSREALLGEVIARELERMVSRARERTPGERASARPGQFAAPAAPGTLAYAIVRLAEAFLYNDAAAGLRGDHERLREVEAALLGVRA